MAVRIKPADSPMGSRLPLSPVLTVADHPVLEYDLWLPTDPSPRPSRLGVPQAERAADEGRRRRHQAENRLCILRV